GDGFLDLFIGGISPTGVSFFLNNGDGTFSNITAGALETAVLSKNTFSAAFGDYDHDNDLDLFMTHWGRRGVLDLGDTSEHLWRNNGDTTFTDVSIASGIASTYQGEPDFTFSPTFADINNDGYLDILIAADFLTSEVFINQKNGTFINTTNPNVIIDQNGMGAAVGDYDNDGDLDWFVSSIFLPDDPKERYGNRLYRNNGDGTFEDVTVAAGVDHGFWGWGSCMYDFDNDGNLDLLHVNGFGFPPDGDGAPEFFADPTRLFISNGNGTFTERALELGLDDTGQGRGIVCFDYDKDGDIDIFITNNNQSPKLFRNDGGNTNNFLSIKLNGLSPNREGVGSRVTITVNNQNQIRELRVGSNFVSQNPVRAHFGLGNAELVNLVQVDWADGETTVLQNVSSNQFLEIDHPNL
ncbi:MAG: CRTAC1 family protein, partial [Candidatus Dadabacteria bacterium]